MRCPRCDSEAGFSVVSQRYRCRKCGLFMDKREYKMMVKEEKRRLKVETRKTQRRARETLTEGVV